MTTATIVLAYNPFHPAKDRELRQFDAHKLIALPASNCVVAIRGTLLVYSSLVGSVLSMPSDFAALAESMPSLIEAAVATAMLVSPDSQDVDKAEIVLAGFSPDRDRVELHHFRKEKDGPVIVNTAVDSVLAPWGDEPVGDVELSRPGMLALAKRQVSYLRSAFPDAACGGNLIVAEVRRGAVNVEVCGEQRAKSAMPARKHEFPDINLISEAIKEAYAV